MLTSISISKVSVYLFKIAGAVVLSTGQDQIIIFVFNLIHIVNTDHEGQKFFSAPRCYQNVSSKYLFEVFFDLMVDIIWFNMFVEECDTVVPGDSNRSDYPSVGFEDCVSE